MSTTHAIIQQFINLGIGALIAGLVWRHYRAKTYPVGERYGTFWPRFWTGWVDNMVFWPLGFGAFLLLLINGSRVLAALVVIAEGLPWLFYTVYLHARCGQTIGKMVTKVRVVDFHTEQQITLRQAWLREAIPAVVGVSCLYFELYAILTGRVTPKQIAVGTGLASNPWFWISSILPLLWFLAEVITMLSNEKRRALHDYIAGTIVVRTNATGAAALDAAPDQATPLPT